MSNTIKITVKYKTRCKLCSEWLTEGEQAYFEPSSPDYLKLTCVDCFEALGEDLEVSEAKKQLSVNDLCSIYKDCSNDNCNNKSLIKFYFCTTCYSKLPYTVKQSIMLSYSIYMQDKKKGLPSLTKAHRESLPYLDS